jgi:hypothetical protein
MRPGYLRGLGPIRPPELSSLRDPSAQDGGGLEPPKGQEERQRVRVTASRAAVHHLLRSGAGGSLEATSRSAMGTAHSAPMVSTLDPLESLDEALKRLGLETAIGVGDEGPGQT